MKLRKYLNEDILDYENIYDDVKLLQSKIKAPFVNVYSSALGGKKNVAILITFSLDDKKDWANKILENSRYVKLYFDNTGVIELTTQSNKLPKKWRKVRVKSVDDAISKINKFIDTVK